jgi:hypothetical protein
MCSNSCNTYLMGCCHWPLAVKILRGAGCYHSMTWQLLLNCNMQQHGQCKSAHAQVKPPTVLCPCCGQYDKQAHLSSRKPTNLEGVSCQRHHLLLTASRASNFEVEPLYLSGIY